MNSPLEQQQTTTMTTNSAAVATSPPRRCIPAVGSDPMTNSTAETPPAPASSGTPPDLLPSAALRHRRGRTASQSSPASSSPASSISSSSSASTTPSVSPSPRYSAVPFSWEHRPGIPKKIAGDENLAGAAAGASALPLPPPLRSYSDLSPSPRKKRSGGRIAVSRDDPFAIALAACAKDLVPGGDDDEELERLWGKASGARRPRRGVASPATAIAGRLGIFQLYGSCKSACSVAEETVRVPRPCSGSVYALLDPPARRSGSRRS